MQISLSPDLERLIAEQAQALGYATPEEYLRTVIGTPPGDRLPSQISDDEFSQILDELGAEENLPSLPAGFSRADIYADHD